MDIGLRFSVHGSEGNVPQSSAGLGATLLDHLQIGLLHPALPAVGQFDAPPGADGVEKLDLGAFVQDEQVLGRIPARSALHCGHRAGDDGAVRLAVIRPLPEGEVQAEQGEHQRRNAGDESGLADARPATQQEEQHAAQRGGEEDQEQDRPGVGGQQPAGLATPLLQEEFRYGLDLVLDEALGEFEVEAGVGIGRVQLECALVVQDGMGEVILLEAGVAQVVIEFRGLHAEGADSGPGIGGSGPVSVAVGGHAGPP